MGNQHSENFPDMSFDMTNPFVPFNQFVPGGLKPGKVMELEGVFRSNGKGDKWNVNFYGENDEKEILFHHDVRHRKHELAIVMNSMHKGHWEAEERVPNIFKPDQRFKMKITITQYGFEVIHDNSNPHSYNFRDGNSPDKVRRIAVEGNVQLFRIFYGFPNQASHGGGQQVPQGYPPQQQQPQHHQQPQAGHIGLEPQPELGAASMAGMFGFHPPSQMPQGPTAGGLGFPNPSHGPIAGGIGGLPPQGPQAGGIGFQPQYQNTLSVPYKAPVNNGLAPGRQIVIHGHATKENGGFAINLEDQFENNIALHINVRFNENCIVRNSKQEGNWGTEDRSGGMPISQEPFQMQILCEPNDYKIAINGRHFTQFPHRLGMNIVNSLRVNGDISLSNVNVY